LKTELENQLKIVVQRKDYIEEFKILKKLNKSLMYILNKKRIYIYLKFNNRINN